MLQQATEICLAADLGYGRGSADIGACGCDQTASGEESPVADQRMRIVHDALAEQGVELAACKRGRRMRTAASRAKPWAEL